MKQHEIFNNDQQLNGISTIKWEIRRSIKCQLCVSRFPIPFLKVARSPPRDEAAVIEGAQTHKWLSIWLQMCLKRV